MKSWTDDHPRKLQYSLVKEITNNFTDELGRGAFGRVFKGLLDDGEEVAVKVLRYFTPEISDQQFQNEFGNLKKLKHPNIVRLLGFCDETEEEIIEHKGKLVVCYRIHRALCLEYVPNGNLRKFLSGGCLSKNWPIRYKIIKGICEGLQYLHKIPIFHFDLKPDNILLDEKMLPKITDFGLSRLIGEGNTKKTMTPLGTVGYLPPEFIDNQIISREYDIYSLGVIIMQIITGVTSFSDFADMEPQEFIEHVHDNWKRSLEEIPEYASLEADCKQVKRCMEIAINCRKKKRHERPTIEDIVSKLDEMESKLDEMETVKIDTQLSIKKGYFEKSSGILGRPCQLQSAGAVLLAVTKIGSILGDETSKAVIYKLSGKVHSLKELPWKVDQIRKKLTFMSQIIQQIGTVYLTDELVNNWIGEVRKVAYRVEDVVDKYSYHVFQLMQEGFLKKFFIKGTHYSIVFSAITDEIADIEEEINQVIHMKDNWLHETQLVSNHQQLAEIERHRSEEQMAKAVLLVVIHDDLVGIEENRRLLTGWLNSDEQITRLITVSGMGGLGKTTLVTNVYEREKNNFTTHAWIVVSQNYDVVKLLRKLLRKIGEPEQSQLVDLDARDLKAKVKERLAGRKCLIVLDDVWNQEAYTQIRDAFQNLQASCVIITTRQEQVAVLAHPTRQLKLKPLDHGDAHVLFCRKAFYNTINCSCPDELEKLANNIVDRCQGLPLAIVTMGGLLSALPPIKQVWNETYKQFQDQLTNNDHVRAILNLSYHDLPGNLRNCFLYCSLYPEDHLMSRESLVWLWVAEGFALQNEQSTPEEVADRYLRELIQRNMLEAVENDELGRVRTCKMHDLVRDLALSVAKEEKFGFAYDFGTLVKMDKGVRRLSSCGWQDKTSLKVEIQLPRLRTAVALGIIGSSPQLLSSVLSESTYLTVLELQDSEISEVPASIGNMFNLRYIGLRRTRVKSLPESIGKLSNLQTLDIKATKIEKLPRSVVKIKKLRHLLADRFADEKQSEFRYFIGVQAPKELSNLEELQTLETLEANKDLAEQLIKLTKLRSVWIDNISAADCANLFSILSKMPLLSSLLLSTSDENETLHLENLKPASENFHRLIIRGCWADKTLECPVFRDSGRNLKYLAISWCHLQEDPLQLLAPYVPNLTYLSLNRVSTADTLVLSKGCFPQLKTLVLKRMPNVDKVEIRVGALQQIEGLYVVSLLKLDKVPQGIESLRSLKKLWLLSLHKDFRGHWDSKKMQQKMQYVQELRI